MPALPSEPAAHLVALRVTLAFAGAITAAEGFDLELSFVAALVAATLALGPAISPLAIVILPVIAWAILTGAVLLVEMFAPGLMPFYLVVLAGCLWLGFTLSARADRLAVIGLLILVASCIVPLRVLSYPEATGLVVDDMVWNVLTGVAVVVAVGLVLPGAPAPVVAQPRLEVMAAPIAAVVLALAAWLVWVLEPPAPGAVLIGMILTLRPDVNPGLAVARDRVLGALVGGGLAVVAATVVGFAHVLPALFLVMMVLAWPLALHAVRPGRWQGAAVKSLYALAILTGEGFSPLFEDTAERLGIRIVGVLIGVAVAAAAIALLGRRKAAVMQAA